VSFKKKSVGKRKQKVFQQEQSQNMGGSRVDGVGEGGTAKSAGSIVFPQKKKNPKSTGGKKDQGTGGGLKRKKKVFA